MRRIQVTTRYEVEEEDATLRDVALTDLARAIEEDMQNANGDGFIEFVEDSLTVDVQMMPRTQQQESEKQGDFAKVYATPPNLEPLGYADGVFGTTQSYIFPPDHDLAPIERAYRSGESAEDIARKMRTEIFSFKQLSRGED